MILNYTHRMAFIHIPKCAGSSVKDQLRVLDETGGRYERGEPHPRFGRVHRAHLPLWLLEELYPEDFAALREFETYAVLRDPQARFASALAQRISQFRKRDPFELSAAELGREIDEVIGFLTANPGSPALEFCHFIPQRDFVDLRGARITRHLYRLEDVALLLGDMGARAGQVFATDLRSNQKLDFRFRGLKAPAYAANALLRRVLPAGAYAGLKSRVTGLVARKGKGPVWGEVLAAPEVRSFVETYYREDAALLEAVPPRAAAPGA